MTYTTPYRDAVLVDCNDSSGGIYYAISSNEAHDDVMSKAAYDVVDQVILDWFNKPDVLSCKLGISDQTLRFYVKTADGEDHLAEFTLPLAEVVLSAAHTAREYADMLPSDVSDMLRKLADDIDALYIKEQQA